MEPSSTASEFIEEWNKRMKEGRENDVMLYYDNAFQINPKNDICYFNKAISLEEMGQNQAKVQELKQSLDPLKVEVDSKMDYFNKKLVSQLKNLEFSPDDQMKVKDYFKAFIGTFSSAFVTSQVIESGQVSLDVGSSAGTLLSTLATFVPFTGNTLSSTSSTPSTITSIDEFLSTKEMKTNARKMLTLFSDSTHLSTMIGQTACQIVLAATKQREILSVTDKELDQLNENLFQKIIQFCGQMSERIDVFSYTKCYNTAAARLGHIDANDLIQAYFEGKVSLYRPQEEFVDRILNPQKAQGARPTTVGLSRNGVRVKQAGCCNVF